MDGLVTQDGAAEAAGPKDPAVAACVQAELADLGEARAITMRFLRRLDRTAEALRPEQSVALLAEDGQMILNLVRADRALRQIVVMEQEVMGLREPPSPRGGVGGRDRSGGGGSGGERLGDLNDLNDLGDLDEVRDINDLMEVEDVGEIEYPGVYYDMAALEKYDTYDEFDQRREEDPAEDSEESEAELDRRIMVEVERAEAMRAESPEPEMDWEERRERRFCSSKRS